MKKWIVSILMVVCVAGLAGAEGNAPWWKMGFGGGDKEQVEMKMQLKSPQGERPDRKKEQRRSQVSEEQRGKMKAHYEAVHKLTEAARAETDPVKKAELTEQLRSKLTDGAQKMQVEFRKRVEKAESEVVKMKRRLEKGEQDLAQRVDEHLKKLLAGEKPERKGGPKEGKNKNRKGPPAE